MRKSYYILSGLSSVAGLSSVVLGIGCTTDIGVGTSLEDSKRVCFNKRVVYLDTNNDDIPDLRGFLYYRAPCKKEEKKEPEYTL